MKRRQVRSGAKWESIVGYCRAVRVGPFVQVAGTTATEADGTVACPGDAYGQAQHILETLRRALEDLDARLEDVVRTRIFVTDIAHWEAIGKAHGEVFGDIQPAATMVEVSGLIDPQHLLEIEADAIVADAD